MRAKSISPGGSDLHVYAPEKRIKNAGFLDAVIYSGFLRFGLQLRSRLPEVEVVG